MVNKILDTAFLVAFRRSQRLDISQDKIASLWYENHSFPFFEEYPKLLNSTNLQVCLRSRFFLEQLKEFSLSNGDHCVINLGSGLSSYPYLFENKMQWIEIDLPEMVKFKYKQAIFLKDQNKIPERKIIYIPANLQKQSERKLLLSSVQQMIHNKKVFILMEGLLYYLNKNVENKLFQLASSLQKPGDKLGFDVWPLEARENNSYKAWARTLKERANQKYPVTRLCDTKKMLTLLENFKLYKHYRNGEYAKFLKISEFNPDQNIPTEFFVLEKI